MSLPFVLLALAVAAIWLPPLRVHRRAVPAWPALLAGAVATALAAGVLQPAGLAALIALGVLAWSARRARGALARAALAGAAALLALAVSLHLLPGFTRPLLFDHVLLTPDAVPFTQALDFGKATAGLLLLAAFCLPRRGDGVARTGPRASLVRTVVAMVLVPAVVLTLGVALGLTRFEPHLPAGTGGFLTVNLLFTCVAEEAFFRGLIAERMLRAGDASRRPGVRAAWRVGAILVSTLLFTAAHLGADARMAAAIAVAGLGYGLTLLATRRIGSAIAVHFAVNAVQFLLFAYPALAR